MRLSPSLHRRQNAPPPHGAPGTCGPFSCTYLTLLHPLCSISATKRKAEDIAKEHRDDEGGKKKPKAAAKQTVQVSGQFRVADLSGVVQESSALKGVVAVLRSRSQVEALQKLVATLGGTVHANPTALTTHVISGDESAGPQVAAWIEAAKRDGGKYDIVHADWLRACGEAQQRVPLEPRYVLYAREESHEEMLRTMDEWGDRYEEEATAESLRSSMELVRKQRLKQRLATPMGSGSGSSVSTQMVVSGSGSGVIKVEVGDGGKKRAVGATDLMLVGDQPGDGERVTQEAREAEVEESLRTLGDDDVERGLQTRRALLHESTHRDASPPPTRTSSPPCHGPPRYSIFRGVVAYAANQSAIQLRLRMGGARIALSPDAGVTHVVLPPAAASDGRLAKVRESLLQARCKPSAPGACSL